MYVYARRYRGHESIPHCHEPRHISTITDSFPPCVPCPPKFAPVFPGYFPFPTFPPFRYPTPRSASSPLPFAYIRGRLMKPFEKDSSPDRPYSLFFPIFLSVCTPAFLSTRGRNESAESMCSKAALGNATNISSGSSFYPRPVIHPTIYIFTNEGGGSTCCRVCSRYAITLDKCLTRYVSCNRLDSTMSKLFERDGENKPSFHTADSFDTRLGIDLSQLVG